MVFMKTTNPLKPRERFSVKLGLGFSYLIMIFYLIKHHLGFCNPYIPKMKYTNLMIKKSIEKSKHNKKTNLLTIKMGIPYDYIL